MFPSSLQGFVDGTCSREVASEGPSAAGSIISAGRFFGRVLLRVTREKEFLRAVVVFLLLGFGGQSSEDLAAGVDGDDFPTSH
jgi:hypothetical protein